MIDDLSFVKKIVELSLTHLRDGTIKGKVSEFSVHIVLTRSRLVSNGNTVGLDDSGVLFVDLYRNGWDDLEIITSS